MQRYLKKLSRRSEPYIFLVLLALCVLIEIRSGQFFTPNNIVDKLSALVVPGIFAVGAFMVIVSGGIATAADIRALAPIADAVEGVITGRAIYEGTLTVVDGVAACDGTFHLSDQLEEEGRPLTIEELES